MVANVTLVAGEGLRADEGNGDDTDTMAGRGLPVEPFTRRGCRSGRPRPNDDDCPDMSDGDGVGDWVNGVLGTIRGKPWGEVGGAEKGRSTAYREKGISNGSLSHGELGVTTISVGGNGDEEVGC